MEDFTVTAERFRAVPGRTLHDFLKRSQTWTRSSLSAAGQENH
jgi:hypothetical protein